MEDVFHSSPCAMESSSVSMAQMSPAAVEVSTTKITTTTTTTKTKLEMVSAEHEIMLSKEKKTIIVW